MFDTTGRRPIDRDLLGRMTDALVHRGPDGSGLHMEPGLGLGHRRLSIIDIEHGAQPMTSPETGVVVSYNGEIYNFPDLRVQLAAKGHRFQTHCDTEVILHGWAEWGPDCLDHFDGMFAFALWDPREEMLFLARDRFGKKPLYYAALHDGLLLFGSELKALMHHPDLPRGIDPQAVEDYFSLGYVPDPKSIYRSVRKLPAGQCLSWQRGGAPSIRAYWDIPLNDASDPDNTTDIITRLRDATNARLISDVPLGAFLSGGIDSGGVVSQMAALSPDPVRTFTVGFETPEQDESPLAQMVADRYHTRHTMQISEATDLDLMQQLAAIYDEPFADNSAMPTFRVSALARQQVTVVLSGDGADELLAGYDRYRGYLHLQAIRQRIPSALRKGIFGPLARLYPTLDDAPRYLRAKTKFQQLAADDLEAHFQAVSITHGAELRRMTGGDFTGSLNGYRAKEALRPYWQMAADVDPLTQAQYTDIKTWLPGDILTKVDRASMANSLEVRSPFMDHNFAAWCLNLPRDAKLGKTYGKSILRRALEPHLPHDLIYREKRGFVGPIDAWIAEDPNHVVRETVTGRTLGDSGLVDPDHIGKMLDDHRNGRRRYARQLWLLLMLHGFLEHDRTYGRAN